MYSLMKVKAGNDKKLHENSIQTGEKFDNIRTMLQEDQI